MKIRTDFVTNSSSSSFIICKDDLTRKQIEAIREHKNMAEKLNIRYYKDDDWDISESENYIMGHTWLDNFMFGDLLKKIKVPSNVVTWDEYIFDLHEYEGNYDTNNEMGKSRYED